MAQSVLNVVFDVSDESFEENFMRFVEEFNEIVESQNSMYIWGKSETWT